MLMASSASSSSYLNQIANNGLTQYIIRPYYPLTPNQKGSTMIDTQRALRALSVVTFIAMAVFGTYVMNEGGKVYDGGYEKITETKSILDQQNAEMQKILEQM